MPTNSVLVDDRLLVGRRTGAAVNPPLPAGVHTTSYWYYRACRAAVLGASGQLSGPFAPLGPIEQARAIAVMLRLPDDIGLPDARLLIPIMVDVVGRHPRLNVMNVEAVAAAHLLHALVVLSPPAATGAIVPVLEAESIRWSVHEPASS